MQANLPHQYRDMILHAIMLDEKGTYNKATINEELCLFSRNKEMSTEHTEVVMNFLMVQNALQRQDQLCSGLKQFGRRGEHAVKKELNQLQMLDTFYPVYEKDLSHEEKKTLTLLIFLTEKKDSTIKALACTDGQKQRNMTEEGTTASSTVSTNAIFMTAVIEAHEG